MVGKEIKRYWLFGGEYYYPNGGMADFKGDFDSAIQAEKYAAKKEYDWFHIFDSLTKDAVAGSNNPEWDSISGNSELSKKFHKFMS